MLDPQFALLVVMIGFVAIMVVTPILSLMGLMVANALVSRALRQRPDILELARNWGYLHCPGKALCVEPTWERDGVSLILVVRIKSQDRRQERLINAPILSKAIGQIVKRRTFFFAWFFHIFFLPRSLVKPSDVMVLPIVPFFCEIPRPNAHEKMRAAKKMAEHTLTAFASQPRMSNILTARGLS